MMSAMEQLAEYDGYSGWREQEAIDLSHTVQSAIARLQAPSDCAKAKKMICP